MSFLLLPSYDCSESILIRLGSLMIPATETAVGISIRAADRSTRIMIDEPCLSAGWISL